MNDPIEQQLSNYIDLSPSERSALEAHVRLERPDLREALAEAQQFAALLEAARPLEADPTEDALLAHLLAKESVSELTADEQRTLAALRERAAQDATLQERLDRFQARREKLLASSENPVAQFERLTGRPIEEDAPPRFGRTFPFRAASWLIAAGLIVAIVCGGVLFASQQSQSELERLATLRPSELQVEGYGTFRGATPADVEPNEALYLEALATLREARQTTFGLFPRFDERKLAEARRKLETVIGAEEEGSFLQLEASYFLGKTLLAQGDVPAARESMQRVVAGGGMRSDAAREVLERLQ